MQHRRLSIHGPQVSEIGFGGWAIGGGWGEQDHEDSVAALYAAIDGGVNFIDTAEGYGDGHSERVISAVSKDRSEEVLVATKTPPAAGPWPPSPHCRWQDRYSAAYLRANVEQRLKNLDTECIDLLQLHTWTRAWNDDPQPLLVLRQLREEGKINLIGVSTPEHDQDSVIQLMRDGLIDVVQIIFNVFHQEPLAQLLPVAKETGTGVIVRVALDEGALTGKYASDHQFSDSDFRSRYFAGDRMERTVERVRAVQSDLDDFGLTEQYSLADLSLKYALAPSEVSTVVVGMRNAKQAEMNTRTARLRDLPDEMIKRLQRHNWLRGVWYSGK